MSKGYIFHKVRVHASGKIFKMQAIINTKTMFNLIVQDLVREYNILGDNKVPPFTAANRGKMRFYKQYHRAIEIYGHDSL